MTTPLEPVPESKLDLMIRRHLQCGETVLWQGRPEVTSVNNLVSRSLAAIGIAFGVLLLVGLGQLIFPALALGSGSTLVPALVFISFGAIFFWLSWLERDANWRFAITDRRLLVIRGAKLFRYALPGEVRRFRIHGNIVYWNREDSPSSDGQRRSGRFIGFRGMCDPDAMKATL